MSPRQRTLLRPLLLLLVVAGIFVCDDGSPSGSQPTPATDSLFFTEHTVRDSMFCYAMLTDSEWVFRNDDTLYVIARNVGQSLCPPYRMWHEVTEDTVELLYGLPPGGSCLDTLVERYLEFAFRVTDTGSLYVRVGGRDTLIVIGEVANENPCDLRKLEFYWHAMRDAHFEVLAEADDSCDDASYCRSAIVQQSNGCDYQVVYSVQHTDSVVLAALMDESRRMSEAHHRELMKYGPTVYCNVFWMPFTLECDSGRCVTAPVP